MPLIILHYFVKHLAKNDSPACWINCQKNDNPGVLLDMQPARRITSYTYFSRYVDNMLIDTWYGVELSPVRFMLDACAQGFWLWPHPVLWSLSLRLFPDSAFMSQSPKLLTMSPKLLTITIIWSIFNSSPLVLDFSCRHYGEKNPTELGITDVESILQVWSTLEYTLSRCITIDIQNSVVLIILTISTATIK